MPAYSHPLLKLLCSLVLFAAFPRFGSDTLACSGCEAIAAQADDDDPSDAGPTHAYADQADREKEFDHRLGQGKDFDPFGATPLGVVQEWIAFAGINKQDVLYDLGSGDGRIVIAAAQAGARAVGIEILPDMIDKSIRAARDAGVSDRVTFLQQDFFKTDFSDATVIALYLYPRTLLQLRPLFLDQLNPGTRIIAYRFGIEAWPRDAEREVRYTGIGEKFYKWIVPANVSGTWRGAYTLASGAKHEMTLTFHQTFQKLKGTLQAEAASLVSEPIITANQITMTFRMDNGTVVALLGTVDNDKIQGQLIAPEALTPPKGTWNAERVAETRTPIDPNRH